MKISVIGSGCKTCENVYKMILSIKEKLSIEMDVEYIKDSQELIKRGIMGSPAILINDTPVFIGKPSSESQILKIIKNHL